jgi:threonine dehydrogenase-like Zn-dependent dehydrogenase
MSVNTKTSPIIFLENEPHGLDKGIEASGFRSAQTMRSIGRDPNLRFDPRHSSRIGAEGDQSDTISHIIRATRKGGNIALIGDFFFSTNNFPIGAIWRRPSLFVVVSYMHRR